MTITSFCNACVFYCATLIPITALQSLLISAGTIILFNYITAMTLIPAILGLWAQAFQTDEGRKTTRADVVAKMEKGRSSGIPEIDVPSSAEKLSVYLTKFFEYFAQSLPLKLLFLFIGLGTFIAFAVCVDHVEMGYEESDLAKRGSYLGRGINDMYSQVYSQHSAEAVVFGTGIDYRTDQRRILDTHDALAASEWSAYQTAFGRGGASANTWLENMCARPATCRFRLAACRTRLAARRRYSDPLICPNFDVYNDGTDPWWAVYPDVHIWRLPQVTRESLAQRTPPSPLHAAPRRRR